MSTMTTGTYNHNGNAKLGKHVGAVNRLAVGTCPGASDWCKSVCYADRYTHRWPRIAGLYQGDLVLPEVPRPAVRIHASGDFDTVGYVREITKWVESHPGTRFWAYTRSWRVRRLVPALETLRALPNMQLFASVDASIHDVPPAGWRVAFIEGDPRYQGPTCMEQTGTQPDCESCGYCFVGHRNNIGFKEH